MIKDKNGTEIKVGQTVIVHQVDSIREAKVIELNEPNTTSSKSGHWIDIDFGDGVEGMMSYILEVKE